MALVDINGVSLSGSAEPTSAQIKTALIRAIADGTVNMGSTIGATLAYTSPGTAWEAYAETAYANLLAAYKEVPNSGIPFFISTDQHGRGVEVNRWLNNYDANINGMGVMNLNLGDAVVDIFGEHELSNIYNRSWQIKNHIMVFGNHEVKEGSERPNLYDLNRWFVSTRERKFYAGPMGCFTVFDDAHSVKYVCVANYIVDSAGGVTRGLTTDATEWLIHELAANDGYDIVFLQHWPLFDSCQQRGDGAETSEALNTITGSGETEFAIWRTLVDRKNKANGTYTDVKGVEHSYDFTDCEHDFLLCLHGHIHAEWYTTAKGLTAYAADMCGDTRTCTFGLIDRLNSKVTFWVFDNTGCMDPLVLPI